MNRQDILNHERGTARRHMALDLETIEFRGLEDGSLRFAGYASVTEYGYEVYGGPPFGWTETIARGAFKKTLAEGADVNFLINHEGMSLARTKSGTLTLLEDKVGLRANADLDPANPDVQRLQSAIKRGDIDEMSFGFRVERDEWLDERGDPSNKMVGTQRRITEVNMNKGDVSSVNYGANDGTSGGFREIDKALTHFRAGQPLTDDERRMIRDLAVAMDSVPPAISETTINDCLLAELDRLERV